MLLANSQNLLVDGPSRGCHAGYSPWELCVECFLHAPVASLLNRACVCARGVFLASMRQCVLSSQLAMT